MAAATKLAYCLEGIDLNNAKLWGGGGGGAGRKVELEKMHYYVEAKQNINKYINNF